MLTAIKVYACYTVKINFTNLQKIQTRVRRSWIRLWYMYEVIWEPCMCRLFTNIKVDFEIS